MPVTAHWHDEGQTILVITYIDPWTVDDIIARLDDLSTMLDTTPHNAIVDVILDVRHTTTMPKGVVTLLPHFLREPVFYHPQTGLLVTTNTINRVHRAFNRIFTHMVTRVEMADTYEDALAIIHDTKRKRAQ
jgi:hypothetical protein